VKFGEAGMIEPAWLGYPIHGVQAARKYVPVNTFHDELPAKFAQTEKFHRRKSIPMIDVAVILRKRHFEGGLHWSWRWWRE
jgi:hypothetical protein